MVTTNWQFCYTARLWDMPQFTRPYGREKAWQSQQQIGTFYIGEFYFHTINLYYSTNHQYLPDPHPTSNWRTMNQAWATSSCQLKQATPPTSFTNCTSDSANVSWSLGRSQRLRKLLTRLWMQSIGLASRRRCVRAWQQTYKYAVLLFHILNFQP